MELSKLYEKQEEVDKAIEARLRETDPAFKLYGSESMDKEVFAFKVELMELANEVGFFKYWKHGHKINKVRVLEEWADGLAFLLSIGIGFRYAPFVKRVMEPLQAAYDNSLVPYLFYKLDELRIDSSGKYLKVLSYYMMLGNALGFTEDELLAAYEAKTLKNLARQKEGY